MEFLKFQRKKRIHANYMYVVICRRFAFRQSKFGPNFDEIMRRKIRKFMTFGG